MGWSIGHDGRWGKYGRDIGYGVPAVCDHPDCNAEIDRGLSYVCGEEPYGGDHGCGLFFCGDHRRYADRGNESPALCERCMVGEEPFEAKPDVAEWINWKLTDESWARWRAENPEEVAALLPPESGADDGAGHGTATTPGDSGRAPKPPTPTNPEGQTDAG